MTEQLDLGSEQRMVGKAMKFCGRTLFKQAFISQTFFSRTVLCLLLLGSAAAIRAEVTLNTTVARVSMAAEGRGGEQLESVDEVLPGDVLRYTIVFENASTQDVSAGSVVITNPLPEGTLYLDGSARGADTVITFSVDEENFAAPDALMIGAGASARAASASDYRSIRWTYEPLLRAGESSEVSFDLLIP